MLALLLLLVHFTMCLPTSATVEVWILSDVSPSLSACPVEKNWGFTRHGIFKSKILNLQLF